MAEEALKKLEDQLQCAICLGTYTDPKQLQCHHTYCKECLVRLTVRDQQGQLTLTCPNCRGVTLITTESGVAGLKPAFQINNLLDIYESQKKIKEGEDSFCGSAPPDSSAHCPEHVFEDLKVHCYTCETLVCLQCVIKNAKHHSHDYAMLDKAYEQYKGEILGTLKPVEEQLKTVDRELQQVDARCGEISDQTATVESSIHDTINQFHQTLETKKSELLSQLHQISREKLKSLAAQRDFLEIDQVQLRQCVDTARESLETASKHEAMKIKTTTAKQVTELIKGFQSGTFKLCADADIVFLSSTSISAACQNLGKLFEMSKTIVDTSRCSVTVATESVVGKRGKVLLKTIDCNGDLCQWMSESVNCVLVSEITHAVVRPTIFSSGQGRYEIIYKPTVKGKHLLHLKIGDQTIPGSPFTVPVRSPSIHSLGAPIKTITNLKSPWGVAVNKKGEIFVSEHIEHRISVFSPAGEKIRSFGKYGTGEGQFNNPRGIAVDGEG